MFFMEQSKNRVPLLQEIISDWLLRCFQNHRVPFLASLIWGFLAYTFAFTNKLINHDEVGQLFSKGATVTSGRWGLGLLDTIFPNVSMPWIYGVLTILIIAVSICLIVDLFAIRSKLIQALLAGCIMVFPSLIGVFGYMFTSSSYGLSFLLAVLAVWLVCRPCKWAVIPALGCMVASLSIYQSYVSVSASLLVLILIRMLLIGDDPLLVLKKGIGYVLFLVVSLVAYYLATKVILAIYDISLNEYAADNISFSVGYILEGIRLAYLNFARFFYWAHHRLMPTELSRKLHLLLFAAIAVLLLLWARKQKKPCLFRFLLLAVLIAILPMAINCMYLITTEGSIHTLVLYSFIAVYVLAAIVADLLLKDVQTRRFAEILRRISVDGIALLLSVIVMINVYAANTAYLNLHLRYENAYSFFTGITTQVQQMPEFQPGTRIAIIGDWIYPDFYWHNLDFTLYMTGVTGFMPTSYSAQRFLDYYVGFRATLASSEEIAAIRETEAFRDMNIYPYYGSMAVIDNVIVVKLSE